MDWREAGVYAGKLIEESSWSRTVYSYTKAAMLLQQDRLTTQERQQCNELLRYVPALLSQTSAAHKVSQLTSRTASYGYD